MTLPEGVMTVDTCVVDALSVPSRLSARRMSRSEIIPMTCVPSVTISAPTYARSICAGAGGVRGQLAADNTLACMRDGVGGAGS
jgi:hypothetical protein